MREGNVALRNRLLARLPMADRVRFVAACETVELQAGQVLMRPAARLAGAWFPLDAVLSVDLVAVGEGRSIEVALIGREGMVGLPLLLGAAECELTATVVRPGAALSITADGLRLQLAANAELDRHLRRYVLVAMAQLARAVLCARYHRVDERLARLLLMTQDRCAQETLHVTHAALAGTLGVRRAGVTRAANDLQRQHLIAYHRGTLAVVDRPGLQRVACACYLADRASYAALMGERRAGNGS
jgi:CRP-like cAMP-binding protein